jgi:hypothetical protein
MVAVGGVAAIAGFFREGTAGAAAVVIGLGLVALALLLPWIARAELRTPAAGVTVETRPPEEVAASALAAEQPAPAGPGEAVAPVDADERARADARHLVASAAVDQLLHPADGPLAGCEFRVYRWFADRGRLLPVLDPARDPQAAEGWAPGQGAAGVAWRDGDYVAVEGAACSDDTYGLTLAQQDRYRDVVAVAAVPVANAAGEIVAVLTASSRDPGTRLTSAEGREAHLALAGAMARILVDLLRWESDG